MPENKEMPLDEKYNSLLDLNKLVEDFATHLVNRELGKEKSGELKEIWAKETERIPEDASEADKYEIAYKNFLQTWVTGNNFMGKYLGEEGTLKYNQAAISAWKGKYAGSAFALRIIGGVSRKTAFSILSKRLAYQLQVFSPFSLSEIDKDHMTLNVSPCKINRVRGRNDFCLMACQNIIPTWLEGQFNTKMSHRHQGENCVVTFSSF